MSDAKPATLPERGDPTWVAPALTPDEQTLFARLGIFVGGFTLNSAEAICNPDGALDVFAGIETLLRSSLLRQVESPDDEPRFDMLLTIRDYALEKLEATGELAHWGAAHAAYFAQRAIEHWRLLLSLIHISEPTRPY